MAKKKTLWAHAPLLFLLSLPQVRAADLIVDRIENSRTEVGTVYFKFTEGEKKPPPPYRTGIVDLFPLGSISSPASETPYFLFSGVPCSDCKETPSIYILRSDGRRPNSFIYPGKIVDSKTGDVLLISRAFFGRCLWGSKTEVYMVYQQERVDRRKALQPSVYIAEPGVDHLMERLINRRMPRLQDTLKLVKQKACFEISGKNRATLRKLLDLRPARDPEKDPADGKPTLSDDEDDDAPPKENQTDRDLAPQIPPSESA